MKDISAELARYEIGWWKAHHRKDEKGFINNMIKLYSLQFGLSFELTLKAVKYRLKAATAHDMAEKFEDEKHFASSTFHWLRAENFLKKHFKILQKAKLNN